MEGDSDGGGEEGTGRPEEDGLESEVLRGKNMDVASMDALKKRIEVRICCPSCLVSLHVNVLSCFCLISPQNILRNFSKTFQTFIRTFSERLTERHDVHGASTEHQDLRLQQNSRGPAIMRSESLVTTGPSVVREPHYRGTVTPPFHYVQQLSTQGSSTTAVPAQRQPVHQPSAGRSRTARSTVQARTVSPCRGTDVPASKLHAKDA